MKRIGNKRLKRGMILSFLLILALQMTVSAAENTLKKEVMITASDEENYKAQAEKNFSKHLKENGRDYTLKDIEYEITNTEYLDEKEKVIEVKGEPDQTIIENDDIYTLVKSEIKKQEATEAQIVTAYDSYDHVITAADVPATKEITAINNFTGEEESIICSFTGIEPAGTSTVDSIMTITFSDYDASYYFWNGNYIARNDQTPPLSGYEDELLAYCNAADGSKITGYYWNGDPYTSNGVICRDAAANVRQVVQTYRANYQGEFPAPEEDPLYVATYSAPDLDGQVEMTVKATATYMIDTDYIPYILTGVGIMLLIALLVAILFIIKKNRKQEMKEMEVK